MRKPRWIFRFGMRATGTAVHFLSWTIGCDFKVINRIVNGKAQVTPKIAIKLGAAFNTSPDFWLNAPKAVDIYEASREITSLPKSRLKKSAESTIRVRVRGGGLEET